MGLGSSPNSFLDLYLSFGLFQNIYKIIPLLGWLKCNLPRLQRLCSLCSWMPYWRPYWKFLKAKQRTLSSNLLIKRWGLACVHPSWRRIGRCWSSPHCMGSPGQTALLPLQTCSFASCESIQPGPRQYRRSCLKPSFLQRECKGHTENQAWVLCVSTRCLTPSGLEEWKAQVVVVVVGNCPVYHTETLR